MTETVAETRLDDDQVDAVRRWSAGWWLWFAAAGCAAMLAGCRQEVPVTFNPNLVHSQKYEIQTGLSMDQASADAIWVVNKMFGTPNDPKLPDFAMLAEEDGQEYADELRSIVSMDNLVKASGPVDAEGRGLFRQHCVLCHGVTGSGRGTSSSVLQPYPRDYRMGVFKFKSTPRGVKPAKNDLAWVIRHGINGTAMNSLAQLANADLIARGREKLIRRGVAAEGLELKLQSEVIDGDTRITLETSSDEVGAEVLDEVASELETYVEESVAALTDYVIYLSWRGEMERRLVDYVGGPEQLERVINPAYADSSDEEERELFDEQWLYAEEDAAAIAEAWLEAPEEVVEAPEPPAEIPVARDHEHFMTLQRGDQAEALAASVKRGAELFRGKLANCGKCHGEQGRGEGQTTDYDVWTKDWTTAIGLDPKERSQLIPLLARGALPPVNAQPRNFELGVFHGGDSPERLFLRISQGIDGSPMPAATYVESKFEEEDVWHLINFIRSLYDPPEKDPTGEVGPAA